MESSSVLITLVAVVLLAPSVFPASETYTVYSTTSCTKEILRRMVVQMCSRDKRSSDNETKADPIPPLTPSPTPLAMQKKRKTIPSSLDTLFFGLFGNTDELKYLIDEQERQRIERAENKLMLCCLKGMCSPNDFENAC